MPARTPQQIFQHHAEALGAEDIDGIAADYSDDAFFMTPAEVQRGKAGIRHAFTKLLSDIPQAKWNLKTQLCYRSRRPTADAEGSDPSVRSYDHGLAQIQ
jgi:hypothetical protein